MDFISCAYMAWIQDELEGYPTKKFSGELYAYIAGLGFDKDTEMKLSDMISEASILAEEYAFRVGASFFTNTPPRNEATLQN